MFGKVIVLVLNYVDYVVEFGFKVFEELVMFFKFNISLLLYQGIVIYLCGVKFMYYEVEFGIVIGCDVWCVKVKDVDDYVGGYIIVNDLVVCDYVFNYYCLFMCVKGWDIFGLLGLYLVSVDEVFDFYNLGLCVYVNGELWQEGSMCDMIFKVFELIEFMSCFMILEVGDVILIGMFKGVLYVYFGDVMCLEIDGLGVLENLVVLEDESVEFLIVDEGERKQLNGLIVKLLKCKRWFDCLILDGLMFCRNLCFILFLNILIICLSCVFLSCCKSLMVCCLFGLIFFLLVVFGCGCIVLVNMCWWIVVNCLMCLCICDCKLVWVVVKRLKRRWEMFFLLF